MTNNHNWTFCDKKLPETTDTVAIIVAELNHGETDPSKLYYVELDYGHYEEGIWHTWNDWDEGQPWAVVAWSPVPTLEEIKAHNIAWENLGSQDRVP